MSRVRQQLRRSEADRRSESHNDSKAPASIPIIRTTLPPLQHIVDMVSASWADGRVTIGPKVAAFEQAICRQTGAQYAVAVSSCTAGLMLVPQALSLPRSGEVIVPAFTFAATAQALVWNGLTPVFCDCLPGTMTLDPEDVRRNLSPKTVAICPVYIYGLPPDIEELLEIGEQAEVPVYFDAAQGLGSTYRGKAAGGFGACEVFSLSPTKVVTAIEGGVITTNDAAIAARLRSMRDYGKDPDYGEEMVLLGLSARMSEIHAVVGLASTMQTSNLVAARLERIVQYRKRLGDLRGCRVQDFPPGRTSSGNYFVLFISSEARAGRDEVYTALKSAGIQTKRYFYPALHRHRIFQQFAHRVSSSVDDSLRCAEEALALPLFSEMTEDQFDYVCRQLIKLLS
jgi:dTDP-4-amino-4,6-dideoxygalactose transaminase